MSNSNGPVCSSMSIAGSRQPMGGGTKVSNGYVDEKLPYTVVHDEDSRVDYEVVLDAAEMGKYDFVPYLDFCQEIIVVRFFTSPGGSTCLLFPRKM